MAWVPAEGLSSVQSTVALKGRDHGMAYSSPSAGWMGLECRSRSQEESLSRITIDESRSWSLHQHCVPLSWEERESMVLVRRFRAMQ